MTNLTTLRKSLSDNKYYPVKDMFRVAKINNEVIIDWTYSRGGRGSYIYKNKDHVLLAKKRNSLSKGLRAKVDDSIYDSLLSELERK